MGEPMKRAIIVYESVYGNTKKVAEAIAEGIQQLEGVECRVVKTGEIHTDEICDYDAILFGCPNHNQEPALNMIKFLERASIVHVKGKIGGIFDTYTGGNKGVALTKLRTIVNEKFPGIEFLGDGFSAKVEGRKGPLAENEVKVAWDFGKEISKKLVE
ncbi:MAG: FprA family A-type flavoprotein [Candidatus Thorarchaeota archaeon]|nr:FprA family A-type flavoprotein [Candidatus Thorarchaeota archaeon]MCK5240696.1 FprA family A-type flavoprotein [Candidatus Thorarchaeota archaeon]